MITELRSFATDKAIVDWLELRERFGTNPFTRQQIQQHWLCSQPTACRRLQTLQELQLINTIQRSYGYHNCVYVVEGAC